MAHLILGTAALSEDRYDDALSHYERATHINPQFAAMHAIRAMTLALAGRAGEAGPSVARTLELDPSFRFGPFTRMFRNPALAEKWRRGALLAGLPE